ncbi:MAG TPA: universal stress protein [Rubrivivax sp.]|nr:universal stress protein [Rubrivivax sp.]
MYKRILVPVDGSGFSEQLLDPASAVAQATATELVLLRVVDGDDDPGHAAEYVEALAAPLGAKALSVRAGTGGIAAAISAEAHRVPGTLVAMCSHGRSGVVKAMFGNVALSVLRELGEPLVVFRPRLHGPAAPSKISRVVLPLDGSALSETIMDQAAVLAKWLGARLIVVSVIEASAQREASVAAGDVQEASYVRDKARDITSRHGVGTGWEVLHGDPKQAIPEFVRSLGGAMLAMTTHGRTGLQGVITGSVTAQCLRDAEVPVFTRLP